MNDNRPELNNENGDPRPGDDLPETVGASGTPDPSEEEEAKRKINWRGLIIGAVIFVIVIAVTLIFLRFTTELRFLEMPGFVRGMDAKFVLLALACLFAYIVSEGRAMAAAASGIGIKIGIVRSTMYSCVELFFAALTPSASGGQPAVAYFMSKDGIKLSKSSTILLNNTLHYTLSLLVLGTFAIFWEGPAIFAPERGKAFLWLFISGFIANILGLVSCLLLIFAPGLARTLLTPVYRLLAKMHIIKDLDKSLASFEKAVADYGECQKLIRRNPTAQIKTFLWNMAQRFFNCAIAYCVYRGLGYADKSLVDILVIQILVIVAVNAIPLPGSVGASEMVHKQLYAGIYGVFAVPAMLIARIFSFYIMVVIVGIVTVLSYISAVKKQKKSDSERTGS